MPLNIRAKPSQGKLSGGPKSSGHTDGSASHSRFSRSPKQGKGKQALSSAPGSRSGLEPGSVSGGLPASAPKAPAGLGSASRPSSKIKSSTAADKGVSRGSATAPGGKTLSMENIQSLSAAYATSGTMYPSERDSLEPSGAYPKGTMTLGRSTSRTSYTGRTATGSSPNITSYGLHHSSDPYGGDQTLHPAGTSSLRRQSGRHPHMLDSTGRADACTFDLQAQLRDLQRENDTLRRELDGGRDGRTGPAVDSVNFWSPDVKRDKCTRREERARSSGVKESYRSNQDDLQIEQLKQEQNRKETEMQALQTKLETLTNQNSDCKQHIEVLKESLSAKEQRANTLQTEVDALRVRLEEKEQFLTKKTKQLQDLTDEKSTLTGEIRDMKDMLDVKERKVNVLQKKIENLLEQLKDKDKQLAGLRERVQGLQTDSSNTDTALATLEEALSEKERVIENLREQKEREDRLRLDELEKMRKENQELKDKLLMLQPPKIPPSQSANPSPTQNQKPDGEVPLKLDGLPAGNLTAQSTDEAVRKCPDITDRLRLLEQEVARNREESGKSKAEVERLMTALRDAEMDKSCKEKKIADLERQIKSPNIQKQMVPCEMRKDALTDGHPHSLSQLPLLASQDAMRETAERIRDLEKSLRESMNTAAHREALWAQEEGARVQAQRQLEELMGALEKTRQELDATKLHLSSTQQSLHDRDRHLNSLRQERRKQLEEILEMKQQALLAAISEKDANIALLELSSSKRKKAQEEVMALKREKDRLMHQLKQQTQSRMKLIADNYEEDHIHPQHHPHHSHHLHPANMQHRSLPRGPPQPNHRTPMDQDDEEGIWA